MVGGLGGGKEFDVVKRQRFPSHFAMLSLVENDELMFTSRPLRQLTKMSKQDVLSAE